VAVDLDASVVPARFSVSVATRALLLAVAAIALACAAPFLVYPMFLMKVLCFALFACAFNLLIGFTGLLSFGHAAFFGGAAYITAHVAKVWGWPPELAILAGTAFSASLGLAFGWLAIRRQGIYFAMVTLAFAQMIYFLASQMKFTGGEDGIQAVPRGYLFGFIDLNQQLNMYFVVLAIFLFGFALIWRIVHSPFGQVLKAIRENEPRAVSLVFQLASLSDVTWNMSGDVILMTLLGGMGTMLGPVVGAALVVALETQLAGTGVPVTTVIGAFFVACVLMFRRGIVGELIARLPHRRQ
jgi:branched-chain amino acid transport system permease protein